MKARLIEKVVGGPMPMASLGEGIFQALPHVGEHIEVEDSSGIAQIYAVLTVIHSSRGEGNDLIVQHVGESSSFRLSL